jgi:hypothetical protein
MKKILVLLASLIGINGPAVADKQFPPVPSWKPEFMPSIEEQLERMAFYTNQEKDLVVFQFGTIVLLEDGLNDEDASKYARETLYKIYNYHPDMNPVNMKDGNILVQYNHPAFNVVLREFAEKHMSEIEANHLKALATDEVLITPSGANVFDQFGMLALYGRTFMFMDAQDPKIVKIHRKKLTSHSKAKPKSGSL